jgi:hypothetical protein
VSQVYEWLPWIGQYLNEVPAGKAERLKWLATKWIEPITPAIQTSLVKWYGEEKAAQVKFAEAFEICEYGAQPGEAEIRRFFPMLVK